MSIGKLSFVSIDVLWRLKYPYCKLTLNTPIRFRIDGKFEAKLGETEIFFVNKPAMVLTLEELKERFPKIYDEVYESGFVKSVG